MLLLLRLIELLILLMLRIETASGHWRWQLETIQHVGYWSSLEIGVLRLLWKGDALGLLKLRLWLLLLLLLVMLTEIWLLLQWHRC